MCSVVGYVGDRLSRDFVLQGLEKLEYRGYDSAGFACIDSNGALHTLKAVGQLSALQQMVSSSLVDGAVGIGHTRWATHGQASEVNAHPHTDCSKKIALVHNGIIENASSLRVALQQKHHLFESETDTEIIAHLLEDACVDTSRDAVDVVCHVAQQLEGAFACVALSQQHPDTLLLFRKKSPLCIGFAEHETYVASDSLAFPSTVTTMIIVPDETCTIVTKESCELYQFDGTKVSVEPVSQKSSWVAVTKGTYEHYMLKEIYEQKKVLCDTLFSLDEIKDAIWQQFGLSLDEVQELQSIHLVACGTSWHAARIAQFYFESILAIPTYVSLASEFRSMHFFNREHALYLFISQSGETADTLEALRLVKLHGAHTISLTNSITSTMVREADGWFATQAGPEVAVASTKAFSTQLVALYWLAFRIAVEKKLCSDNAYSKMHDDLLALSHTLELTIKRNKAAIDRYLAPLYAQYEKAIFLGRHISYPFAMEAALKLKEVAYIFSQCYPAGELKHGPLALIDVSVASFVFSHHDETIYKKLVSNVQEIKARGGRVCAFIFEGQQELSDIVDDVIVIPRVTPLLGSLAMTGVMQYFVYVISKLRGCSIDKPRNLAKSVTVE